MMEVSSVESITTEDGGDSLSSLSVSSTILRNVLTCKASMEHRVLFEKFLCHEHSEENLHFLIRCEKYRKMARRDVSNRSQWLLANQIYKLHLKPGSSKEIIVSCDARTKISNALYRDIEKNAKDDGSGTLTKHLSLRGSRIRMATDEDDDQIPVLSTNLFKDAQDNVFNIMYRTSYPRFVQWLSTASAEELVVKPEAAAVSFAAFGDGNDLNESGGGTHDQRNCVNMFKDTAGEALHVFVVHSFSRLTYCHVCNFLLVGLTKQGYKCLGCGLNVHKKCIESATSLTPCEGANNSSAAKVCEGAIEAINEMMMITGSLRSVESLSKPELFSSVLERKGRALSRFELFLKAEYSEENLMFYRACSEFSAALASSSLGFVSLHEMASDITARFLTPGSRFEVNIDSRTQSNVLDCIKRIDKASSDINVALTKAPDLFEGLFDSASTAVFKLMATDTWPRYIAVTFSDASDHEIPGYPVKHQKTKSDTVKPSLAASSHNLSLVTYLLPTFCCVCSCLLRGLINQGYRCADCCANMHYNCIGTAPRCLEADGISKELAVDHDAIVKGALTGVSPDCTLEAILAPSGKAAKLAHALFLDHCERTSNSDAVRFWVTTHLIISRYGGSVPLLSQNSFFEKILALILQFFETGVSAEFIDSKIKAELVDLKPILENIIWDVNNAVDDDEVPDQSELISNVIQLLCRSRNQAASLLYINVFSPWLLDLSRRKDNDGELTPSRKRIDRQTSGNTAANWFSKITLGRSRSKSRSKDKHVAKASRHKLEPVHTSADTSSCIACDDTLSTTAEYNKCVHCHATFHVGCSKEIHKFDCVSDM